MDLDRIKGLPKARLRALTGMTPAALAELLMAVLPELIRRRREAQAARPNRQRAVGGGRTRSLTPAHEVLMVLIYLRHNVAHEVVGQMFGVSADTSENLFHEIVPLLRDLCPAQRFDAEKRWNKSEPSWRPDQVDRV